MPSKFLQCLPPQGGDYQYRVSVPTNGTVEWQRKANSNERRSRVWSLTATPAVLFIPRRRGGPSTTKAIGLDVEQSCGPDSRRVDASQRSTLQIATRFADYPKMPRIRYPKTTRRQSSALNSEIVSGRLTFTGCFLVFDCLALIESTKACPFDRRYMNEHVFATTLRLNESIAFGCIKPFHGTDRHQSSPITFSHNPNNTTNLRLE
jgi:hypothetical protein